MFVPFFLFLCTQKNSGRGVRLVSYGTAIISHRQQPGLRNDEDYTYHNG